MGDREEVSEIRVTMIVVLVDTIELTDKAMSEEENVKDQKRDQKPMRISAYHTPVLGALLRRTKVWLMLIIGGTGKEDTAIRTLVFP